MVRRGQTTTFGGGSSTTGQTTGQLVRHAVSHSSRATTHKEPECIGARGQGRGQLVRWSGLAPSVPLVLYTRFE